MSKEKGAFAKFGSLFVESDDSATVPREETHPQAAPAPIAAPISFSAPIIGAPILNADDQAQLHAIETQIYSDQSAPYVMFQKVRASLGNTTDLKTVFNVLSATTNVTPAKVLADIETHLGDIEKQRAGFETQLTQAKTSKIDEPNQKIADLNNAIQTAQQSITANQSKIAELTAGIQGAQQAIANGEARFKAIEDTLNAPLIQSKQLLGSMT